MGMINGQFSSEQFLICLSFIANRITYFMSQVRMHNGNPTSNILFTTKTFKNAL